MARRKNHASCTVAVQGSLGQTSNMEEQSCSKERQEPAHLRCLDAPQRSPLNPKTGPQKPRLLVRSPSYQKPERFDRESAVAACDFVIAERQQLCKDATRRCAAPMLDQISRAAAIERWSSPHLFLLNMVQIL